MVHQAARGRDNNLYAGTERLELGFVAYAAEDGDGANTGSLREFFDFVLHLHAELARRHENQGLRVDMVAYDDLQKREHVGAGFARARLGLHEHVTGRKHVGDGLLLDRHQLGPAVFRENFLLFFGEHVKRVVGELVFRLDNLDRSKERVYFFFLFFFCFFTHSGHKDSKWRVPR